MPDKQGNDKEKAYEVGYGKPPKSGQFKPGKGVDPRIWRKGKPKSFDALRELAQQIAHEVAVSGGKPVVINGHICTNAEVVLRQWLQSNKPTLQQGFMEVAFGKPPQHVELSGSNGGPIEVRGFDYGAAVAEIASPKSDADQISKPGIE